MTRLIVLVLAAAALFCRPASTLTGASDQEVVVSDPGRGGTTTLADKPVPEEPDVPGWIVNTAYGFCVALLVGLIVLIRRVQRRVRWALVEYSASRRAKALRRQFEPLLDRISSMGLGGAFDEAVQRISDAVTMIEHSVPHHEAGLTMWEKRFADLRPIADWLNAHAEEFPEGDESRRTLRTAVKAQANAVADGRKPDLEALQTALDQTAVSELL